jgi:N-acyl-D-amino-acid deacylase
MAMTLPWVATASDGSARVVSSALPHPRSFGTFPRKIGFYALQEKVITVEHAIETSTSLPARILGLSDRGLIKEDYVADIAIFDPETFRDRATFEQPYLPPSGMRFVLVNGKIAVYEGLPTGTLAGKALRKR